jgi:hypothetical protein
MQPGRAWPAGFGDAGGGGADDSGFFEEAGDADELGPPDRGGRQQALLRCCATLTDAPLLARLAAGAPRPRTTHMRTTLPLLQKLRACCIYCACACLVRAKICPTATLTR